MLKYDVRGEGSLAILLHSGGMSGRQWRRLAERLAPRHRVVSPDFLGSGANPPWPDDRPFDFRNDVAAVVALWDSLGEPAHIVGHSYGGFIAFMAAKERPAQLRSIAAYDPVTFGVLYGAGDRDGLADLARATSNPTFTDDAIGGQAPWFEAFVDYWNGAGAWKLLPAAQREAFLKSGRKVYGEVRSLMQDRTPAAGYAQLTAPALLMTGERSPAAARRVVALLAATLPAARAASIAGAGHMGPITHADDVNARIERHMAEADSKR
ncbi:MAG TPA: alpha/beta hydrolase [Polyangia bacterium]|nr:alpha/beta hydrolase [Polyangia bacterium]